MSKFWNNVRDATVVLLVLTCIVQGCAIHELGKHRWELHDGQTRINAKLWPDKYQWWYEQQKVMQQIREKKHTKD